MCFRRGFRFVSQYNQKQLEKVNELHENAQAMKEKETSTANKLLGSAAMGAAGIGASQFFQGQAEQATDAAAEADMRAYLATFICDYGVGIQHQGGETDITLPGGNDMISLYTEYKNIANKLKKTKETLGLAPGIESETMFDKAEAGLYDNASTGKTDGAYASISRALSDKDGADASEWNEQKSDSASLVKTGGTVAGIGIVGGAVGNLIINKGAAKEKSSEITDKYPGGTGSTVSGNTLSEKIINAGYYEYARCDLIADDCVQTNGCQWNVNYNGWCGPTYSTAAPPPTKHSEYMNFVNNECMKYKFDATQCDKIFCKMSERLGCHYKHPGNMP
jgi:hypothetical protein